MASAMGFPMVSSPEEIAPTRAMSSVPLTGLLLAFDGLDSGLVALAMPFFMIMGLAPAWVLDTLGDDGLGQQGGGGGAVAGHVVGLGGHFLDHGCAHVLKRVVQLNFAGDGDAVVGDQGVPYFLSRITLRPWGPW